MKISDIKILTNNPFFSSKLIAHFLSGCKDSSIKFELVFFVLPILNSKETVNILQRAVSTSTIDSFFTSKNASAKYSIINLKPKYDYYKHLTHMALVVASKQHDITISEYIKINKKIKFSDTPNDYIKPYFKAAFYLGVLLSKENHIDVLVKLGVKQL